MRTTIFAMMLVVCSGCTAAFAAPPGVRAETLSDKFPWLRDFIALLVGAGILIALFYFFRSSRSMTGFIIHADEEDISFTGDFPPHMQQTVIDFLRNDCNIAGSYQVRGHWEDRVLIVVVRGTSALPYEQRIRNFLKLHLKPTSSGQ